MTTEEIVKMAYELGLAIAQSEAVEGIKAAQNRLMMDKTAYDLMMRYQDARTQMQHKIEDSLFISEAEENHLNIMEQQLQANDVVKELIDAQDKLDNLMQAVYFTINQTLTGDSCGSDCTSCCGGCNS